MKIIKNLIFTALAISILAGCEKEKATLPSYLSIPRINLTTTPGQGSDSHKINYAFVYVNDQFVGGYELPATFPILTTGPATVLIEPGVQANGVSETPDVYPFYKRIEQQVDFNQGQTVSIVPTTSYKDNTQFAINESFNSADHIFTADLDNNANTKIEITNEDAFEGNSAEIILTSDDNAIIVATDFSKNPLTELPQNGTPVWLEINYKTDLPIIFGVVTIDQFGSPEEFPEFGINTKTEWNKIYFDVSRFVQDTRSVGYQIFCLSQHSGDGEKTILLDNIRLVYFN